MASAITTLTIARIITFTSISRDIIRPKSAKMDTAITVSMERHAEEEEAAQEDSFINEPEVVL